MIASYTMAHTLCQKRQIPDTTFLNNSTIFLVQYQQIFVCPMQRIALAEYKII